MQALTTTEGQRDLPRYFARVFDLASGITSGRIDFVLPDGRVFRAEGPEPGPVAEMHIHAHDLFARIVRDGDMGFAEGYLDGWWTTPDLQAFMDLVHADNDHLYDDFLGMALVRAWENLRFWLQSNTKRQAKKNISAHYDLGNAFYRLWLDDSMTYSSALFQTGQESLEKAQEAKYAALADAIGAKPGDHVLEIGCGWGGFAEYAAKERGLKVTGVTISKEQHAYATDRMARAGLSDQVDIRLQDYRDIKGTFDGIASIEMFEAVGQRYWPTYFNALRDRLKPGGRASLQVILVAERRWDSYRKTVDFIQKYIFPGGMLPAPSVLRAEAEKAGLAVKESHEFADSYGLTLRRWHETFNQRWDEIAKLGFDGRFRRMWNFYLTSCAASFESGICDVTQVTLQRQA
ncbi:MAG: cyclopropane-fatty-acyl-phospholipid synthase family protein [Pseudomonadota bacterium]